MSLRPIASGTVSFGLVAIPVKLYSTAESAQAIRFNMLHEKCGSRVQYRYFCPTDDEFVERDELVKGYEFAKGQYVLFTPEELKAISPEPTNAVEILEFVPLDQVDPIYFEKSYFLGPDKGGARPYRLLVAAMRQTGRAALARYAARGKDYLVLVRPFEEGLIMQQLYYGNEVRSFSEVPFDEAEIRDGELALAVQLVEQIASDEFDPMAYEDEVKKQVRELIERKVQGEEIVAAAPQEPKAQIIDLMDALKASLGEREAPRSAAKKGAKKSASRKAPKASRSAKAAPKRAAQGSDAKAGKQ
jgi:DNA end-binding protein Ku